MKLPLRLFVTAVALWVTVRLIPGIEYEGHPAGLLAVALVFGVVRFTSIGGPAISGNKPIAAREDEGPSRHSILRLS